MVEVLVDEENQVDENEKNKNFQANDKKEQLNINNDSNESVQGSNLNQQSGTNPVLKYNI